MTVHCKEKPYDVYIGRGKCPNTGVQGIWGNPFVIGEHGTREEVVAKYADWIIKQPAIIKNLHLLKGKTLGCWCNVSPCHGHVIENLVKTPKLAIIGSRTFVDYERLLRFMLEHFYDDSIREWKDFIVVSGGAKGADGLGKKFATEQKIKYIEFPADWDKNGKSAGFIRNQDIIQNSDTVIALWDGVSKGTQHSLGLAKAQKKTTIVIYE